MIPPIDCPYKELTAQPCWSCSRYIPDTNQCAPTCISAQTAAFPTNIGWSAQSYEDRLRDYEKRRDELLKLSKEALVDLIIHRPSY